MKRKLENVFNELLVKPSNGEVQTSTFITYLTAYETKRSINQFNLTVKMLLTTWHAV